LLDPTSADMALIGSVLPPPTVSAIGLKTGESTRSLCLEDPSGRRRWVFSRLPEPGAELGEISANAVYVDYYPEFVEYLNRNLVHHVMSSAQVIVNLSAISSIRDVPRLVVKPSVVQASISRDLTFDEAAAFAIELGEVTGAQKVLVTQGARGAVLAIGKETWHSHSPARLDRSILGAGAVFASEVILGLLEELDRDQLLEWAVRRTALRLESPEMQ